MVYILLTIRRICDLIFLDIRVKPGIWSDVLTAAYLEATHVLRRSRRTVGACSESSIWGKVLARLRLLATYKRVRNLIKHHKSQWQWLTAVLCGSDHPTKKWGLEWSRQSSSSGQVCTHISTVFTWIRRTRHVYAVSTRAWTLPVPTFWRHKWSGSIIKCMNDVKLCSCPSCT